MAESKDEPGFMDTTNGQMMLTSSVGCMVVVGLVGLIFLLTRGGDSGSDIKSQISSLSSLKGIKL
jgi:hypothetical protein